MTNFSVAGKTVTVVGARRSGVAAALLLADRGARVTLTDLRPGLDESGAETRLRRAEIHLELGEHRPETFATSDLIVLSPGVPLQQPQITEARKAGVPVIGEIELASRWLAGRLVAITGTKGKSTTTTLTGRMFTAGGLRALIGGNIGTPLSSQVADSTPETFHIVEVSSFQLEATETFHPWIAVMLNFSPDHLDRHTSIEEYAGAKGKIFSNQTELDWAVINADDPQTLALAREGRARKVRFSLDGVLDEGIVIKSEAIRELYGGRETPLVPLSSIRLIGRHLLSDVMAATAVARIAGVSPDAMVRAVESFDGLEHALEPVATINGARFVNDSKATNIDAAKRAIESFESSLVVIMGGHFKGGDFRLLREPLKQRKATVVAIGEAAPLIKQAFDGIVPVHSAITLAAAVRRALELVPRGGTVLLAPACSSFDMFRDYAERGQVFKREVMKLVEESGKTGPSTDAQGGPSSVEGHEQ
jgi:UDP-N-acetylmuramoylalanine--D-glutamate ligase